MNIDMIRAAGGAAGRPCAAHAFAELSVSWMTSRSAHLDKRECLQHTRQLSSVRGWARRRYRRWNRSVRAKGVIAFSAQSFAQGVAMQPNCTAGLPVIIHAMPMRRA